MIKEQQFLERDATTVANRLDEDGNIVAILAWDNGFKESALNEFLMVHGQIPVDIARAIAEMTPDDRLIAAKMAKIRKLKREVEQLEEEIIKLQ